MVMNSKDAVFSGAAFVLRGIFPSSFGPVISLAAGYSLGTVYTQTIPFDISLEGAKGVSEGEKNAYEAERNYIIPHLHKQG